MDLSITDISVINETLFGLFKGVGNLAVFKNSAKDNSPRDLFAEYCMPRHFLNQKTTTRPRWRHTWTNQG